MAIGFERRRASLIGGGDLPTARLADTTPNLSGLQRVGDAMLAVGVREYRKKEAEAEERRSVEEQLRGMRQGRIDAQTFIGKDENGRDVELVLPQGSNAYLRGWVSAFDHVQDGKFRRSLEDRYNAIQARQVAGEITPDEATTLMRKFLSGAVESGPMHRRGYYEEMGETEISQRSGLMTLQDAREKAQTVVTDLQATVKDTLERAVSHAVAGGDPAGHFAEIERAYQSLVDMNRIGPKEAELAMANVRQLVSGQVVVSKLVEAMGRGEIGPEDVDRFGTAIETNDTTASAVVNRGYEVSPIGEKAYVPQGITSSEVFANVTDPDVRKDMGLKLRQAATDYKQQMKGYIESQELTQALAVLASDKGRAMSLDPSFRDDVDELVGRSLVQSDPFTNPQAAQAMFVHLSQTKYVPKPLAAALANMARMSDPAKVDTAIQFYRSLKTLRNRHGDAVGQALRASMPDEVVTLLEAMDEGLTLGFSPEQIVKNIETARGNDEFGLGNLITRYNDGTEGKYKGDLFELWSDTYGGVIDPEAQDAFDFAYRQNFIVLRDPQKAFEKAWEAVSSRYRASEIMLSGVERGADSLENPSDYEVKEAQPFFGLFGNSDASRYEWINDSLRQDVLDRLPDVILPPGETGEEMTTDEFAALFGQPSDPSGVSVEKWLGRTGKLVPVPGSNPEAPEYMIEMFTPEGHHLGPVMVRQGSGSRPLIVNPHLEKAQIEMKAASRRGFEAAETAARDRLKDIEAKLFFQLPLQDQDAWSSDVPMIEYVEKVKPEFMGEYNLEKGRIVEGLEAARKRYEEETGESLPPSKVGPQSLLMPRAGGVHVAAAAAATIDRVLPDGTGGDFLMRIAAQESNFGKAKGTFRPSGDKGITQVNTRSGFREVKRRIAMGEGRVWAAAQKLKNDLGLDLTNLQPDDLDKPLVAMAVARLYVEAVGKPVPSDLEGQARWWKRHYNTYLGSGTADQFVRSARKVPENWRDGWQVMPTAGEP